MSTRSDSITAQIDALHRKIALAASTRKYEEIDVFREEIRVLEEQRLSINKVSELKILMSIMTGATQATADFDKMCVSETSWNPASNNNGWEQRANKRILLAIYEAVVELDRKINTV